MMLYSIDPQILIADICHNLITGITAIKKHQPQIVFLDIEMPGQSGLEILDYFNENEINFQLVFTTAFNQYAVKAFELSATDYLLKPLQEDKLIAAIEKCKKRLPENNSNLSLFKANLQQPNNKKIALPVANGLEIVSLAAIEYFEADGSNTKVHINNQPPITIGKKLKYFEDLFDANKNFLKVHKNYMVNINSIKKFTKINDGQLLLNKGIELPIAAEKINDVVAALNNL
ncbi:MAG: DNA-binding response regulator [Flavobacterium sp.]|nr:MAG: DNA-binding response regulator [Flavobacterium sp.]